VAGQKLLFRHRHTQTGSIAIPGLLKRSIKSGLIDSDVIEDLRRKDRDKTRTFTPDEPCNASISTVSQMSA